eukprot:CAMPEP_0119326986 /NCGR_PEP_ID=MMETSP1333-20130426/69639_1 /TAXON_ID=418940 /ORGANISM="Scyphosphaera apsteinii, Strain RCC1455" /LENGTH=114 /DNA_ID=CAMNT_0007335439 /DNA_START=160 /DNA_END=504 /DNA_ORIENTATION=-
MDHRISARGINKHRWDDICAEQLDPNKTARVARIIVEQTEVDPDRPGLGQFYCIACAQYYISEAAYESHCKSKPHRRRLKMLTTQKPYLHAEANAAASRGDPDNGRVDAKLMST